jgi:WD40 repeat protein/TPR repeat protein
MVEDNGRLELLPPTQSQLSQMIRRPAAAAGIGFEHHKTTDAPLNEVIAEEVAYAPGALPLLSYLMDQLYRSDVLEAHGTTLTFATYERLGRLEGAIATKAEAVLEACAPDDRQALGSVLFALVQMSTVDGDIERAVSRRVQLANFPRGTPQHNLIEALLHPDARLLVSDAEPGGHPTVRLAHEALITRWERARDFVQGNAQALKIRRRIEERYALWRGLVAEATADTREPKHLRARLAARRARFEREKGLLTEIDLIDGQRLLREHRTDTEPQLVDYIERSEADDIRIRGRAVRVLTGVASVVTVLALLASAAGLLALQKQHEAESQTQKTLEAQSRSLIQAAAERLQNADVSGAQGIILEVLANRSINPVDRAAAIDVFQDARAADTQLAVLSGHDKSVYSSNYSPDHRHIVTASNDGTARIWDASSGAQLAILSGHVAGVTNAAYSPDGKHIVTASYDKTARIWDASSGAQVAVLSGHQDAVWSAAYSPDGGRIVTASFDGTARIWDTGNSTQIMVLSGHHDPIVYAAWSPDGKRVVTASEDKTARIWDATTGGQLVVLSGHGSIVTTAAFSPDGNRVVTASEDKTARVWDARTGAQLVVISGHKGEVYWAAWSPDGARIATASIDKTARIWDAGTGAQVALLSGHHEQIFWTAWSPDGTRVTTASSDRTARIWDARKSSKLPVLAGDDNFVYSAAYSPDGKRIVTASDDGTLHIWDATTGARLSVLTGHGGTIRTVAWSPDGSRIVSASDDKTARIWDAAKGTQLLLLSGFGNELKSAAFSPDGRRVITASNDGTARIWDARTRARLVTLKGHGDRVSDAAWSPDGKRIVTASYDKTARIWDAETGAQLAALVGHGGYVNSAAWSPDGKRILTASNDKTARIWDVAGGAQLAVLSGGDGEIARASWSPNGTRIVTASSDGTARIWNAVTGLQLAVLAGHADRVSDAEWSPDGRRIVTTSYDKTARIWDAEIPANLDAQITWSQAAQIDSLSDVERARLGLTPDLRLKTWPNSSGKCDSEAAAPYDPDRLAPGVMRDDISAEVATRACADEIAETGNSPRRHYESGRALFAKHDLRGAKRELELAVSQGYRSAQIDLAELLVDPSDEMLAPARAATLYEKAWQDGVPIAAFKLGQLYAHGVRDAHTAKKIGLAPDSAKAWMWYQKGADIGEPNALAKFAEREDANAVAEQLPAKKDALLLAAFSFYTAAAKQAHDEDWPDNEWKTWHYRRATLARLLAREGLMLQVAEAFAQVQQRWSPQPPTPLERVARWLHL